MAKETSSFNPLFYLSLLLIYIWITLGIESLRSAVEWVGTARLSVYICSCASGWGIASVFLLQTVQTWGNRMIVRWRRVFWLTWWSSYAIFYPYKLVTVAFYVLEIAWLFMIRCFLGIKNYCSWRNEAVMILICIYCQYVLQMYLTFYSQFWLSPIIYVVFSQGIPKRSVMNQLNISAKSVLIQSTTKLKRNYSSIFSPRNTKRQ